MNLELIKKNKVGMILSFSIPAIISMVLTAMITVADGFFAGNYVGKEGIAAINLGLPIVYLFLGLGLMVSVGGVAIAGMEYGSGNLEKSKAVFNQTIVTTIVMSIAVALLVLLFFEPMLNMFHAQGIVKEYFKIYYMISLVELPIMIINSSFGMFIRGEGHPKYFMGTNLLTVVLNIVLDALCVKTFRMGIAGIAVSSAIAAFAAMLVNIWFFIRKARVYRFGKFHFSREVFRNTVFNGSSEFIGEMSMGITMFAYNVVIMQMAGVDGVTAFTIVGYISYVFGMIVIGFGQGASTLISFTFGAREEKTSDAIRKITSGFVFGAGILFTVAMVLGANFYCNIFVKEAAVLEMAKTGIYLFVISFLVSGYNGIASFFFTSIGKAKESAVISAARGLVILLLCIFLLPILFGMNGIWLAAPITESLTLLISLFYIRGFQKKYIKIC